MPVNIFNRISAGNSRISLAEFDEFEILFVSIGFVGKGISFFVVQYYYLLSVVFHRELVMLIINFE